MGFIKEKLEYSSALPGIIKFLDFEQILLAQTMNKRYYNELIPNLINPILTFTRRGLKLPINLTSI